MTQALTITHPHNPEGAMSIWANLSTPARQAAIRDLARQDRTESEMMAILGAPDGSIRTIARRLGIPLKSERARKAAESAPYLGATAGNSIWAMDEARRRDAVARKAAKGAREALRAFQ